MYRLTAPAVTAADTAAAIQASLIIFPFLSIIGIFLSAINFHW
jgi:hypothetical protein